MPGFGINEIKSEAHELNTDPESQLSLEDAEKDSEEIERMLKVDNVEKNELIQNKEDGLRREKDEEEELNKDYPAEKGYTVLREVYLRDKDGNIARDPETGEGRRIDFVVCDKDGKVVKSVEVTSQKADKTEQSAKEERIRDNGGNYIKDDKGNLVEIPKDVKTEIVRRA